MVNLPKFMEIDKIQLILHQPGYLFLMLYSNIIVKKLIDCIMLIFNVYIWFIEILPALSMILEY